MSQPRGAEPTAQARKAAEKLIAALGQEAVVDPSVATSPRIELGRETRTTPEAPTAGSTDTPANAQDTGLPIFPGATPIAEQTLRHGADGQSVTAVLTTSAPAAQVVEFYRQARSSGSEGEVVRTLLPAAVNGLDLREVNTRERIVYRIQVAPVEATVYIRLSRHRLP